MPLATAVFESPIPAFDIANRATSGEVYRLLLGAMSCVENDEAIAVDLVRKASTLLQPRAASGLAEAQERSVVGGLAPWQVKRLKAHIREQISSPILLDELARLVKLSTSYFSSAFKVSFGTSPHSYVIAQRVEFAKHRMLDSSASLCEIALDCGLADQAHLSRVFKRITGTTPSAWRRQRQRPMVPIMSRAPSGAMQSRQQDAAQF